MKMFLTLSSILFMSMGVFAEDADPAAVSVPNAPPVLNGHLALVKSLDLVSLEAVPAADGSRPQMHSQLIATIIYNSICQPPASFIVIKNQEPNSYSVIEAHAPPPKDRMSCQAINRVELKVIVSEFYGEQSKVSLIRVNGAEVGSIRR